MVVAILPHLFFIANINKHDVFLVMKIQLYDVALINLIILAIFNLKVGNHAKHP